MDNNSTFSKESIIESSKYKNLKFVDRIEWNMEPIDNYAKFIKLTCDNQSDHFMLDIEDKYMIVGIVVTDISLKYSSSNLYEECLYIIVPNTASDEIYVSVGITPYELWYKFTDIDAFLDGFDKLYDIYGTYNLNNDLNAVCRGFLGTEQMLQLTIDDISSYFICNGFTDALLWGSKWDNYPFRDYFLQSNHDDQTTAVINAQALRQIDNDTCTISVLTLFSDSVITVEDNLGAFTINIKYRPISTEQISTLNKSMYKEYPTDLPVDVIMAIINFPFVTHTGLLKLEPITNYNIIMSFLVANSTSMYNDLEPYLQDIVDSCEDDELVILSQKYLDEICKKRIMDVIMDDDTFALSNDNSRDHMVKYISTKIDQSKIESCAKTLSFIEEIVDNLLA